MEFFEHKLNWRYMILRGKLGAVLFVQDSQPDDINESQALDALLDTFLLNPDQIPVFNKRTGETHFDDTTVVWYQRGFLSALQTVLLHVKEEMHPNPQVYLRTMRHHLEGMLLAYRWLVETEADCATIQQERHKRETSMAEAIINGMENADRHHAQRATDEGYLAGLDDLQALRCNHNDG